MLFKKYLPRGIIYHDLSFDFINLFKVWFTSLKNYELVDTFEKQFAEYNQSKYCVAFPFARVGIYQSLKVLDIPKESEIIMPPITIKGILEVVLKYGIKPNFVDIDPNTYCFNIDELSKNMNKNTKSILITYLYGVVPEMEKIINFAKKNNLIIIEDFSQCLNGKYSNQKVGNFGSIGIYSSSTTKTFDTYGGGLCVTNDENLYKKLKKIQSSLNEPKKITLFKKIFVDFSRNLLTNILIFNLFTIRLIKLIQFFKKDFLTKYVGERDLTIVNTFPKQYYEKFSSFQANVGQLTLDLVDTYDKKRLGNIKYIVEEKNINNKKQNIYWQYLYVDENKDSKKTLEIFQKHKIDTSNPSLPLLSDHQIFKQKFNCESAKTILSHGYFIPSYHKLKRKDINRVKKLYEDLTNEN